MVIKVMLMRMMMIYCFIVFNISSVVLLLFCFLFCSTESPRKSIMERLGVKDQQSFKIQSWDNLLKK